MKHASLLAGVSCLFAWTGFAEERRIQSRQDLLRAVAEAKPGDILRIEQGQYEGGIRVASLKGEKGKPIVITGISPDERPVFTGGRSGWHVSNCEHVTIRNMIVRGAATNGINIDDGGHRGSPSHHVKLEHVDVLETGPRGNRDGIKLSGVDHFTVSDCRVKGWGGSAIDMVGCHHGVISRCHFEGRKGFSQSNGVQMKGGSSDLVVRQCNNI